MTGRLRTLLALRIVRIAEPVSALELVRPDGFGWYLCPVPGRRALRPEPAPAPAPAPVIVITVHGTPVLTDVILPTPAARP